MVIIIEDQFQKAHEAFREFLFSRSKQVFTSWRHPFLVEDEIAYKYKVLYDGRRALQLEKWDGWLKTPGKIIGALKAACDPSVSANLLEHRYGKADSSESPLYKTKELSSKKELENKIFQFFRAGASASVDFGNRFDSLADFFRKNSLGCKWPFLAYLAFLADSQRYFPILPTRFEQLLHFYGTKERIAGFVSWDRYRLLVELADLLKSKLAVYGEASGIEIQSYMFVVSYLIQSKKISKFAVTHHLDFTTELDARVRRAREKERIGLLGERFVYEEERTKLVNAHRSDLADKVRLISVDTDESGYDLFSFQPSGEPVHIEIKATTRSQEDDFGFWLSEKEKCVAEVDGSWVLYRVWRIDSAPYCLNLGNVVQHPHPDWEINASSWFAKNNKRASGS
jgi:hypothetical protein